MKPAQALAGLCYCLDVQWSSWTALHSGAFIRTEWDSQYSINMTFVFNRKHKGSGVLFVWHLWCCVAAEVGACIVRSAVSNFSSPFVCGSRKRWSLHCCCVSTLVSSGLSSVQTCPASASLPAPSCSMQDTQVSDVIVLLPPYLLLLYKWLILIIIQKYIAH